QVLAPFSDVAAAQNTALCTFQFVIGAYEKSHAAAVAPPNDAISIAPGKADNVAHCSPPYPRQIAVKAMLDRHREEPRQAFDIALVHTERRKIRLPLPHDHADVVGRIAGPTGIERGNPRLAAIKPGQDQVV